MASDMLSLSSLFQNRLFRIPDYQRGFAWQRGQLADLWDDLINLHEDRYHYTGLLSLKPVNNRDARHWQDEMWLMDLGYQPYHVVDGQQRLTSFSILLHEIVQLVKHTDENRDKPEDTVFFGHESIKDITAKYVMRYKPPNLFVPSYLFGYETDNPSSDYLRHKIYGAPDGGTIIDTYYTRNLKIAKQFFADNLKALYQTEGMDGIEKLYKKLTQRFMFNLHEIDDDYDVFIAFETMNNRGKKLTNLELLKNRLIYLTTLYDDSQLDATDREKLRANINSAWKEVYFQLGRNPHHPLSDDDFLRTHWILYYRYSRAGKDEYIQFLLNKFAAKNVFEKRSVPILDDVLPGKSDDDMDDDDEIEQDRPEIETVSKLSPQEIFDYVNSLKAMVAHWYDSFFPKENNAFTADEKAWIDKLNRISIGVLRPLLVAILASADKTTAQERIKAFEALERFIFIAFRMGNFNTSYKSSDYLVRARDLLLGATSLPMITDDILQTTAKDIPSALSNFITRIERMFDRDAGMYGWSALRYFLYEYEDAAAYQNNLQKVDWDLFTKAENDKVSIEHILPQTPSRWYWRNQFRQYSPEEIKTLSGSLGNLLPLAQSINSSLQNDSFPEKKSPTSGKRRGYINGSHSEIEVSREENWSAQHILDRGMRLLDFMERRWDFPLTTEQKEQILHLDFLNEAREDIPELPQEIVPETFEPWHGAVSKGNETEDLRLMFWTNFVAYCAQQGRGHDIGLRKPSANHWSDVSIGRVGYHITLQIVRRNTMRIGIFAGKAEDFAPIYEKRGEIEALYGEGLVWPDSDVNTNSRIVTHAVPADVHNPELYPQHFQWFIDQFDRLLFALGQAGL